MAGALAKARPSQEAATILKIILEHPLRIKCRAGSRLKLSLKDACADHSIAMTPARDAPMRATRCHGEAAPPKLALKAIPRGARPLRAFLSQINVILHEQV
jgi:hypothetical protein